MFIKSQGGIVLINTEFVYVPTAKTDNTYVMCRKEGIQVKLGKYCSNDRDKEVLDTICDAIEDGMEIIEHDDKSEQSISRYSIFDMPNK